MRYNLRMGTQDSKKSGLPVVHPGRALCGGYMWHFYSHHCLPDSGTILLSPIDTSSPRTHATASHIPLCGLSLGLGVPGLVGLAAVTALGTGPAPIPVHKVLRLRPPRTWIHLVDAQWKPDPLPSPARPNRGSEVELGEDAGGEEAQRSGELSGARRQGMLDERKKEEEKSTDKDAEGDGSV